MMEIQPTGMPVKSGKAISEIDAVLEEGSKLIPQEGRALSEGVFWQLKASFSSAIDRLAPAGSQYLRDKESNNAKHPTEKLTNYPGLRSSVIAGLIGILQSLRSEYAAGRIVDSKPSDIPALSQIEKILFRFHLVASQLTKRHKSRSTLSIQDEYDVQDLFHALLRIYFDDIRAEEWTPSYAGKCSRIDFLLKAQRLVIEAKKTREKLAEKEIRARSVISVTTSP